MKEKYYKEVSAEEMKRYREFLNTHRINRLEMDACSVLYYSGGRGEKTLLTFSGGHSGPEAAYETILRFEDQFRIVVVDVSTFDHLDELNDGVNRILEREGIGRVVVMGHSFSGFFAQAYLRRNRDRIDAMLLTNTPAPRRERNQSAAFTLMRLIPFFVFKGLIKRKLGRLARFEREVPSEALEKLRLRMALLMDYMDHRATKKSIINVLKMIFEFNEKDEYGEGDFDDWGGRVLVITSEDDPYFGDLEIFEKYLPDTESHILPTGWKHIAPLVHKDEFHQVIETFIDRL